MINAKAREIARKRHLCATSKRIYIGKKTWALVKEQALAEGIATESYMGRLLKEALEKRT